MDSLLQGSNFFLRMRLFILSVILLLFPFSCLSSRFNSEGLVLRAFEAKLESHFYSLIDELAEEGDEFAPLLGIPSHINSYFLKGKVLSEKTFNEIIAFVDDCLIIYGIDDENSERLLSTLKSICESTKRDLIATRECIECNREAIKVLADICHLFKTPIQRLILTSAAYGYAEMFKDALTLLENIRHIFVSKTDPILYFDFNEKLNFIRTSFDYYFSQREPDTVDALIFYTSLKTEIMAQIDDIINGIRSNPAPLKMYATKKGEESIPVKLITFDSGHFTTNEDLWKFIMDKVNEIRDTIEAECPELARLTEHSVTEVINNELMDRCNNSKPFTIQAAYSSIKRASKKYFASIKQSSECPQNCDDQIDKAGYILSDALIQFNNELSAKIHEITRQYQLQLEDTLKYDFSIVAVSELAKDKMKYAELEAYL